MDTTPTLDATVSAIKTGAFGRDQRARSTVKCARVCMVPSCVSTADGIPVLTVSQGPAATDDEDVESGQPPRVRFDGYSPIPADAVSIRNCISPQGNADQD